MAATDAENRGPSTTAANPQRIDFLRTLAREGRNILSKKWALIWYGVYQNM